MKVICSQKELKNNLTLISRAVPSRPTHPILGNILLEADAEKGRIKLTAFDLLLGICSSFSAEVEEGGSLTIPAKLINDIVARLPEGEVTLVSEENEFEDQVIATLTSASGRFQLRGIKAEEYPQLPIIEGIKPLMLPVSALSEGIKRSLFAASADEAKQVLTGVNLTCCDQILEFAATDGHRLAVLQTQVESETPESESESEAETKAPPLEIEDFAVTIPARALRELEKMLSLAQDTDLINLYVDQTQMIFELEQQRLTTRKLEGAYPDYHKLIPTEFTTTVTVDRRRMLNSLELVAVLTDQKNHLVKFNLDYTEAQLIMSVEAQDLGSAKESIPAEITGDSLEIGFNVKYLMEGLKALPSQDIVMQINQSLQPVIITPLGGLKMTYLIMPVQLKD